MSAPTSPSKDATQVSVAPTITVQDIAKIISYINRGVELNQPRLLHRAVRQHASIRKYVKAQQLSLLVEKFVPSFGDVCPTRGKMIEMIDSLPVTMDDSGDSNADDGANELPVMSTIIPEVEVYILLLIVTTLLRNKLDDLAAACTVAIIERIRVFNRRSLDILSAKAYFYFSLSHEKINKLESIRPTLLALFRTASIRHDDMGQAVLLNLLLRNYLHYNLVEQAQTLSIRTNFPESASNNQFCRYLYYMGRIQAIQLEYFEAYQRLIMAVRKAPQENALGFTIEAYKLTVIVQLLMGEIPERSLFNQLELREALVPYLHLTQAVKNGDSEMFSNVMNSYSDTFKRDKNFSLIQRLSHNVLKTGLKKLSAAYSHILLSDVAQKLRLPSATSASYICAKAIKDGVIEATINYETGALISIDVVDLYATEEPQKAFHKRIGFCLDVHNEAVKSMRYPPDAYKKELSKNTASDEEKTIEQIIKEMEDEMDE